MKDELTYTPSCVAEAKMGTGIFVLSWSIRLGGEDFA
jgi:hypothetical protein